MAANQADQVISAALPGLELLRWTENQVPTEQAIQKLFAAERLAPYSWSNAPGTVYSVHTHSYTKVLYCVYGSIRFTLPAINAAVDLAPGDRLVLPPHTQHGARVGEGGVTCMEAARE